MKCRLGGGGGAGVRYNWTKFPKPRRPPVSGGGNPLEVDCRMPTAGVNPIRIWNKAYLDLQLSFGSAAEAGHKTHETSEAEECSLAKLNVKATKKPEQETSIKTNKANMSPAMTLQTLVRRRLIGVLG